MATIGQSLTSPESSWKRYDNTETEIKFSGKWTSASISTMWNGSGVYFNNTVADGKINFRFYGSKIRFIGYGDPSYNASIKITIDGVTETFSSVSSGTVPQMLCYEKINLPFSAHNVEIDCNGSTKFWYFDAFDIDESGKLLTLTPLSKILLSSGNGVYSLKDSVAYKLNIDSEKNFLSYGADSITNFNSYLTKMKDLKNTSTALGSGKTFEHSANMPQRRIDKITLG